MSPKSSSGTPGARALSLAARRRKRQGTQGRFQALLGIHQTSLSDALIGPKPRCQILTDGRAKPTPRFLDREGDQRWAPACASALLPRARSTPKDENALLIR